MDPPTTSPRSPVASDLEAPSPAPVAGAASLQEVFAREESPLLRYAFGLTGQRETAEDLVQDAFLRLHAHWEEVAKPRAWLFRTVHNLAINHLRHARHQTDLDSQPETAAAEPEPDDALGHMEAVGTLQLLVAELPPQDRQLIRLKYHHHLKYQQISQQTGLSVGNVGYRLHHLLKNLADSLRNLGIESAEG